MSELPSLEAALLEAAHRRYRRSGWRSAVPRAARRIPVAAVAAVAVVVVVVVVAVPLLSGSRTGDERPVARPGDGWSTSVDERRGFEVSVPAGWQLSAESLTPKLTDPRELLSVATFPLHHRESSCNHVPAGALEAMGPRDGFVTVLERGRSSGAGSTEFSARPRSFADDAAPERGDVAGCLGGEPTLVEYWIPFTDAGRDFYAMVVVGPDAPADVRADAFEILDRVRFDAAVQPDWRASD